MALSVSPWNLIRSMKSVDSWTNTVHANIIGTTRVGYKENDINFGGNTTQVVRTPTSTTAGTQYGEQQITVDNTQVNFKQGEIVASDSETHFAIDGEGFFLVQKLTGSDIAALPTGGSPGGTIAGTLDGTAGNRGGAREAFLTRNGMFHWGVLDGDTTNRTILLDEHGYAVLSDHGDSNNAYGPISYVDWNNPSTVNGTFFHVRPSIIQTSDQLQDLNFSKDDSTLFNITGNSTLTTLVEGAADRLSSVTSMLKQYFLESSNVNVDKQVVGLSESEKYFEMLTKQFTVYLGNIDSSLSLFK